MLHYFECKILSPKRSKHKIKDEREKWKQKLEQLILPAVTKAAMNMVIPEHLAYLYEKVS